MTTTQTARPDQTADASELGLAPGDWPLTLGDGFYHRSDSLFSGDDLVYVRYVGADGSTLVVFND